MTQVKTAAVAGLFYPAEPELLRSTVDGLLAAAEHQPGARPQALIAPHAGYRYSGPIAANAYATLAPWRDTIQRVVVLAPSHRVPFTGLAASSADAFRTPLGDIPVDRDTVAALLDDPAVNELDIAFAQEHALEVQLPFLQRTLSGFTLVPLIVGQAQATDVARVIERLRRPDTLIVVSSDLSHYLAYADCRARDSATSDAIERLAGDDIGPEDACGAYPIRGLLGCARDHGWQVHTLDLRNSGDTSGDRSRVVGYGAYAFTEH